MDLKIKCGNNILMPMKGTKGSAAYDIFMPSAIKIKPYEAKCIDLGIAFDIPKGYHIMMYPRSSWSNKLLIGIGVIDEDYTGNVHILMRNVARSPIVINKDERVLQFILHASIETRLLLTDDIASKLTRHAGIGSTGL